MGLPTRNLDDRTFQNIVDEAKKRIAASCPAWTDHNVSDPGITLVELFAWMTEMILYRLNQVPEKNYIKFLELLGLKLREPEAARTQVTFYLSAPQSQNLLIPKGTEVATVRAEGRPSIIFSTDEALEISSPRLVALLTREASSREAGKHHYREHNLKRMGFANFDLATFGSTPKVGNALYLGFDQDLSHTVLGLDITCKTAGGMGIDIANPPWRWEVWHGGKGEDRWLPAVIESDGTGGLNQSGLIFLRLPAMSQREIQNRQAFWLRCQIIEPEIPVPKYEISPRISQVSPASWGGTVWATHAVVVTQEVLGRSDGAPGQIFQVEHTPLLRRAGDERVELRLEGRSDWEKWREVEDFAETGPFDKCYTCDSATGEIRYGPALPQPDGSAHSYGAIPPRGATIRFSKYRYGGGVAGNVQAGALMVLKTSIPYVDRVINHIDATGGTDAETIEMAQMRAQQLLRSRGRAVTESDYESLVMLADSRVQRARCVQPEAAGASEGPLAGQIYILLIPRVNRPEQRILPEQLKLEEDLRESVRHYLDDYRLLAVRLNIREPEYSWVTVEISVAPTFEANPDRVRRDIEQQLYRFLNPLVGGPAGQGWPFGRDLYPSDIYSCLHEVVGIEYIQSLRLYFQSPSGSRREITDKLSIPMHGLIASAEHRVNLVKSEG
jgi:predicted phage baseplate assembly protein